MTKVLSRNHWLVNGFLIFCSLGLTGLECLPWLPEPPGGPLEDSVSVQMVAAATAEIKKTNPQAIIIWAGGHRGDEQPLQAPAETNVWDFLAVAVESTGTSAWYMHYDGSWSIEKLNYDPMGIEYTDIGVVTMDVIEAWDLALAAGYQPPLRSWEMFKPLNPNVPNINYVFNMPDGSFIIVDSVTGEVSQERDRWDCSRQCREAYLDCCDDCREHQSGDSACYAGCDAARNECDNECGP